VALYHFHLRSLLNCHDGITGAGKSKGTKVGVSSSGMMHTKLHENASTGLKFVRGDRQMDRYDGTISLSFLIKIRKVD
jgi:hypothetical protein